ncbi:MAG: protein kinase family protein [Candidatus Doudnabacteria bacterium]
MTNDDFAKSAALRFLNRGLTVGAFNQCDQEVKLAVSLCASGSMQELQVQRITAYKEDVFLLHFEGAMHGLVLRVFPVEATDRIARAVRESALLHQASRVGQCLIPRHLAEFAFENQMIFVTEMLPGKSVTEICIGKKEVEKIADAIRQNQDVLSQTPLGKELIAEASRTTSYYKTKVVKFLKSHFNINIGLEELAFLEPLEEIRRSSAVIVSDRSPANFVIHGERVGAYDFEVTFAGVAFEDWSWFIDDPRLNTSISWQEILHLFCEDFARVDRRSEAEITQAFFISSIFVCIKQSCLMLAMGEAKMSNHYLACATRSAKQSKNKEAIELVRRLREKSPYEIRNE